jgi:hypothetical protein
MTPDGVLPHAIMLMLFVGCFVLLISMLVLCVDLSTVVVSCLTILFVV